MQPGQAVHQVVGKRGRMRRPIDGVNDAGAVAARISLGGADATSKVGQT